MILREILTGFVEMPQKEAFPQDILKGQTNRRHILQKLCILRQPLLRWKAPVSFWFFALHKLLHYRNFLVDPRIISSVSSRRCLLDTMEGLEIFSISMEQDCWPS